MAQLTIEVNGRPYVVGCEDGEEAHLRALAARLDAKVRDAAAGAGQLGETRVMLLAALVLADELDEATKTVAAVEREIAALRGDLRRAEGAAVAALESAAQKLETMAAGSGVL
jgi:cell division protein ZapA